MTADVGALRRRIQEAVAPEAVEPPSRPPAAAAPVRPAGAAASAAVPAATAAATAARPASLRDDPVANHPLVREASALFDATIVRIEAAGSLPAPDPARAGDLADALEPGSQGDSDV